MIELEEEGERKCEGEKRILVSGIFPLVMASIKTLLFLLFLTSKASCILLFVPFFFSLSF